MTISLERDSPVPLFHQIAESLRYKIAVGEFGPGERLPSVRTAAEGIGVHYLTIRKAYQALEAQGLVRKQRGVGTTVTDAGARLRRTQAHVIECNAPQCHDYATQLTSALGMPVGTWLLAGQGIPPAGLLIGTYFHFNEIRNGWPDRATDMRFVAVEIDRRVMALLEAFESDDAPTRVRVCETSQSRVHSVIPDLATIVPKGRYAFESEVVDDVSTILDRDDPAPALFAPRLWAHLEERQRKDPRVIELRYLISDYDLAVLRVEILEAA